MLIINDLKSNLSELAKSGGNHKREKTVIKKSNEIGLKPTLERIDIYSFQKNCLLEIKGQSKKIIYITAHYDKTDMNIFKLISMLLDGLLDDAISWSFTSQGAIDNGSGVTVALELAKAIKDSSYFYTYRILFSGSEESGIRGSRAHVARMKDSIWDNVKCCINIDCVGKMGESNVLVLNQTNKRFWGIIHNIALKNNFRFKEIVESPSFSDQTPFRKTNTGVDILRSLFVFNLTGGFLPQRSYFTKSRSVPTVFISSTGLFKPYDQFNMILPMAIPTGGIHSYSDRLEKIDPDLLFEAYSLTLSLINEIDKRKIFL